jgi:hypothetical protein
MRTERAARPDPVARRVLRRQQRKPRCRCPHPARQACVYSTAVLRISRQLHYADAHLAQLTLEVGATQTWSSE